MSDFAVKLCALERLGELVEREVRALRGRVCAGPADRSHRREFPHLAIVPAGKWAFESLPGDEDDPRDGALRQPTPNTTVEQVGEWVGELRLELGATDSRQRAQLEDLVSRIFLASAGMIDPAYPDPGREMRAGVVMIDAPDCYGARMSFVLDDAEWELEKVFAEEWYSILRVTAELPALVPRYGRYPITDLRLTLTEDLETQFTFGQSPSDAEQFRVGADGAPTAL